MRTDRNSQHTRVKYIQHMQATVINYRKAGDKNNGKWERDGEKHLTAQKIIHLNLIIIIH